MDIPNAPDELNFMPLVEHLSKVSEELSGMEREDFYADSYRDLSYLFQEERSPWQQLQVDHLVEVLQELFEGDTNLGK